MVSDITMTVGVFNSCIHYGLDFVWEAKSIGVGGWGGIFCACPLISYAPTRLSVSVGTGNHLFLLIGIHADFGRGGSALSEYVYHESHSEEG